MLPLSLLNEAQGRPVLVELKSSETYNGILDKSDTYMNLTLKEAILTSADGTKFFKLPECYIRGNNIKYLRIQEDVLDHMIEKQQKQEQQRSIRGLNSNYRGRYSGSRGRGSNQIGRRGNNISSRYNNNRNVKRTS